MITANAMLQSRKKTKLLSKEGRQGEPEKPSVRGPQIKADVSAIYLAFSLDFLWSKLSNLANLIVPFISDCWKQGKAGI